MELHSLIFKTQFHIPRIPQLFMWANYNYSLPLHSPWATASSMLSEPLLLSYVPSLQYSILYLVRGFHPCLSQTSSCGESTLPPLAHPNLACC